jgi:cell fate (sporulation/competence/biofilm development) regulator YlbF (YheA/YmcA/DUF963 family)
MEIMELAAELGKAIKAEGTYKRFADAKKAFDTNVEVNNKIVEYNVQQSALQEAAVSADRDEAVLDQIQARLDTLYKEIFEDPTFIALNEAQNELNALMNEVNETITFNITGERACTHDCSTCSGCH